MKMEIEKLLEEMVMVPGVSGFEEPFRKYLLEKLAGYNPYVDSMGNVIVKIGGGDKKVALVAHMDEIGLVTTHVEKDGYIRFAYLGGIDDRMMYGRVVEIFTDSGIVYGVVGLIPPHLSTSTDKNKMPTWKELAIDIGAKSRDEAISMGVREMLPARWKKDFLVMGKYVVTRGLDDRAGCAVLYYLLENLKEEKLDKEVYFIWTVQEETGLRGASGLASDMKFDEVYIVDSMTSGLMPGVAFHLSTAKIGEGPAIRVVDRKGVAPQLLRAKVKRIARENGIPVQEAITGGTTDAATIYEHGMLALPICIHIKYTHSQVEMMHLADIKNTIDLLEKIVKS